MMENKMFCYQCQETVGNQGCSQVGVCGKTPEDVYKRQVQPLEWNFNGSPTCSRSSSVIKIKYAEYLNNNFKKNYFIKCDGKPRT